MAVSRYWRLVGISTRDNGPLELSELRLYVNGALADAGAAITSTIAPSSGSLAELKDGSAASLVSWPYASYSAAGFALVWDFGAGQGVGVPRLRLGSGSSESTWLCDVTLQSSTDGVSWVTYARELVGITYPGAYALTVLTQDAFTGAVSYWPFDEVSGDVVADAIGANTGTAYGATIVAGRVSNARRFNGWDQKVNVPIVDFPTTSITAVFWAAPTVAASTSVLISTPDVVDNRLNIHLPWGGNTIYWDFGAIAAGGRLSAAFNPAWFSVMAFWEFSAVAGVGMKIYRNRVLLASSTTTSTFNPSGKTLDFGYYASGGTYWTGTLDEVCVFSRGITSEESDALYNEGVGLHVTQLVIIPAIATPRTRGLSRVPERMLPAAELPVTTAQGHLREHQFFDAYNGGGGVIYGTTKEKHSPANTPLRRKVLLLDERSQITIRETWSDATTGYYEFRGVKQGVPYTVISYDYAHNYRAVIADNLTPEAMP